MSRFSATLREHARYPSNQGRLADADAIGQASVNGQPPYITIYLKFKDDRVSQARFEAHGCGVTTAACSVLTELVTDLSQDQCLALTSADVERALEGLPPDKAHCGKVAVLALHDALKDKAP